MTSRRQTADRVAQRLRELTGERVGVLARGAASAAAGHLEVDPLPLDSPPRRRWRLAPRAAVAAIACVGLLGAFLSVKAMAEGNGSAVVAVGRATGPGSQADGVPSGDEDAVIDEVGGGGDEWVADSQGRHSQVPDGSAAAPGETGRDDGAPPSDAGSGAVVVHVTGHVVRPGVVELPAGSRVHQALEAAGGPTAEAELSALNLARVLLDGEQVLVPAHGDPPPAPSAPPTDGPAAGPLNLNAASVQDLDALPGIGPVLAERILRWRTENGPFTMVDELDEVEGIGPALLTRLRDKVTV